MTTYIHGFGGLLGGSFPWSCRSYGVSSLSESAAETTWDNAITGMWNTASLLALFPTNTTLTYTYTSTATPLLKQFTKTQIVHNIAGTSVSGSLPYQACEIVTFRSLLAQRAGRGRWYLPAMATNAVATTGNLLAAGSETAIQTAVNAFLTAIRSSIQLQIVHMRGTKSGISPLSMSPVVSADTSNKIAIQRRRGDKLVPARTALTV